MTDEWFLTLTDVAEALDCSRAHVEELIERGELTLEPGRPPRVAHGTVCAFVSRMQSEAITLGIEPRVAPSFAVSRPTDVLDNHD